MSLVDIQTKILANHKVTLCTSILISKRNDLEIVIQTRIAIHKSTRPCNHLTTFTQYD